MMPYPACITGALVTADALHVQKETARYLIDEKEADCDGRFNTCHLAFPCI
jgi:hypothetical protein